MTPTPEQIEKMANAFAGRGSNENRCFKIGAHAMLSLMEHSGDVWMIEALAAREKIEKVLEYCEGKTAVMWAAKIVGMILDCDFKDAQKALTKWRSP